VRGESLRYEDLAFDSLDGELSYSPDELTFSHAHVRRGPMDATIDMVLGLDSWSFLPDSTWSADVSLEATPVDASAAVVEFVVSGARADIGQFHGRGTRAAPQ